MSNISAMLIVLILGKRGKEMPTSVRLLGAK
ncbi:hypothetical protein EYZ11_001195 [Aspergillus tanneri]|uniref:Uncharacterized protein n=1 Tax=Aspergillus tanneri TaxID=1220188 RepID=A0A4S3JV32_9EURO|nr:hypothetical protein EYZ11_001195 [Aspergillus tanneri]